MVWIQSHVVETFFKEWPVVFHLHVKNQGTYIPLPMCSPFSSLDCCTLILSPLIPLSPLLLLLFVLCSSSLPLAQPNYLLAAPLCKIIISLCMSMCVCLCTAIIIIIIVLSFYTPIASFLSWHTSKYNQQPIIWYKVYYFAMALTPNHSTCTCVNAVLCPLSLV